jgi:hypothetical protein
MGSRHPKDGHNRIPDEAFNEPLIAGDYLGDPAEDAEHDLLDLLRVMMLGELGIAGKIGEKNCDLLPLACIEVKIVGDSFEFSKVDTGG